MENLISLIKVNFSAILYSVSSKGKKKNYSSLLTVASVGGIMIYISTVYSMIFADELSNMAALELLVPVMLVLSMLFTISFSARGVSEVVFSNTDNDLILAMPISHFTIVISRIMAIYIENLLFTALFALPAGIIYYIKSGDLGVGYLLSLLIAVLLLSLIPTFISLIVGLLMSFVQSKLANSPIINNVLYMGFFMLVFVLSFRLQFIMPNLIHYIIRGVEYKSFGPHTPFIWMYQSLNGEILSTVFFALFCILPFLMISYVISAFYKQILSSLSARKSKRDYKITNLKNSGYRFSLLKKEITFFINSPVYALNSSIGIVMILFGSFWSIFNKGEIMSIITKMEDSDIVGFATLGIATVLAFTLATVLTTACSISLEGKYLWIIKELPIDIKDLFSIKVLFQLLFTIPAVVIAVVCAIIALQLPLINAIAILISCISFSFLSAISGLFINLVFPKLDAKNDTAVVKRSLSVFLSLIINYLYIGIGAVVLYFLNDISINTTLMAISAIYAILCIAIWRIISTYGINKFKTL